MGCEGEHLKQVKDTGVMVTGYLGGSSLTR